MVNKCEPIKIGNLERKTYNDHDPHEFVKKIRAMTDAELFDETKRFIWFSAYANNNPRSDYHWMCDACHDECKTRNTGMYDRAHKTVMKECGY